MSEQLLTQKQVKRLDKAIGKNADKLIQAYKASYAEPTIRPEPLSKAGRKPVSLNNTAIDFIGNNGYSLYPVWALDIIEGVARLDWDSKPSGSTLKSTPLSVKNICKILSSLDNITTQEIEQLLNLKERHAQRYLQACKLAMPHLERNLPNRQSKGIECIHWLDLHDLVPDAVELAALHEAIGEQEELEDWY